MTAKSLCVHWWMIGDYSIGRCKKCGATKDFEQLRQAEQTKKAFLRGKLKTPTPGTLST
jgi:hypothetical protein